MKKIGVTGGIGSGKSLVCKIFQLLSVPVFSADAEAKRIMEANYEVKNALKQIFGNEIYLKDKLNKQVLSDLIFTSRNNINKVNSIVHPIVRKNFFKWVDSRPDSKYVLLEAAIIFESGTDKLLDQVINVTAPEELRIDRVCKRDRISREKVIERLTNQLTEKERQEKADINLVNDGKAMLLPQILEVHKNLMGYS